MVAATRVVAYHGGRQVADKFLGRPVTWPATWRLDQLARQVRRDRRWLARLAESPTPPPEVHLKPILAGEVVIDSRQSRLYRFLREHYNDAVAVEMEGAGLASAAHASGQVTSMVIRGISDLAGEKAQTDAAGWQLRAAQHATAFAIELLAALDSEKPLAHWSSTDERSEATSASTVELRGPQGRESGRSEGQEGPQEATITYLSAFRRQGGSVATDEPDIDHLHVLITTVSESADMVTTSYAAGRTDYTWIRLDIHKQLQQIQSQLDQVTQWLARMGMTDELSTFELRHAMSRYVGVADNFVRAIQLLEPRRNRSEHQSLLQDYEAASRSLIDLLWQIHRRFEAARGPRPFGSG